MLYVVICIPMFASAAGFKSHTLPPHFMYLPLLFEYYSRGRCKINFEKNTEAAIKIFSHALRTRLLFASMSAKICLVVREATHNKSVIAATKLSHYYGITATNAYFPVSFRDNLQSPYYCFALKDVVQFPFKVKS